MCILKVYIIYYEREGRPEESILWTAMESIWKYKETIEQEGLGSVERSGIVDWKTTFWQSDGG